MFHPGLVAVMAMLLPPLQVEVLALMASLLQMALLPQYRQTGRLFPKLQTRNASPVRAKASPDSPVLAALTAPV